ncbi:hypothetical protein CPB84DRAFT_1842445 [Gymnopilus junonius]|uniref:Transcobalamin-like C-terminal domain-containing protein n=1 Tax=Gymnopilus junonius TaxID=109634 RepID=A0A9P5TT72_GYMJU|nr:hypothetical protein CPB84DRAFT_1842445 [Gymnopilus junonius]
MLLFFLGTTVHAVPTLNAPTDNVTTPSGGNHHCDGTNNHANPRPGPTSTSALDDAAKRNGFSFDGTFDTTFDDFFITSIAGDTQTATEFWGILVNFQFTPVGGCQEEVKVGDDILWAFDAFNAVNFLKLTGPATVHRNHPVVLTVTDGQTGKPVAGAEVNGKTSGANGKVTVTFSKTGVNGVKAEKPSTIRSNRVDILVLP